ncbi:unnamed protein product [Effrenium voratum]|uniref:Pentatricopeptide repeat-containing protein n=1 Tax=Effrenium voratum TaxID=2562239 RepID=A0AA36JJW6_9DINO|nr:unnamed protein product [Effrenium voratum]
MAAELLLRMPHARIQPTVVTYNAMISTCALAACWEQAVGWFAKLQTAALEPTVVTYNSLSNACGAGKMWVKALSLWRQMRSEGIQPTAVTISSLGQHLRTKGALRLLSLCRDVEVQPDLVLCNTLLGACERMLRWQQALLVLQEMPSRSSIWPDEVSYNTTINALELSNSWPLAVSLLQQLRLQLLQPSIVTYNTTMGTCEKSGSWERTLSLWQELHQDGLIPSQVTGDIIVTACGSSGKWMAALGLAASRPLGLAGLAAAWRCCESAHVPPRLQAALRRKVTASLGHGSVWRNSTIAELLQATVLGRRFLWKVCRDPARVEDTVVPGAAARGAVPAPALPELPGDSKKVNEALPGLLPLEPTVGVLPVVFELVLQGPSWSATLGPAIAWASVSDKARRT